MSKTENKATERFSVHSQNFDYHPVLEADSFDAALALAKKRGFDALIYAGPKGSEELRASWSALYGVRHY